ncbi:hypothetical protein LINGRAHAP2_LOCUS12569, partial [Linum grandiflorum]
MSEKAHFSKWVFYPCLGSVAVFSNSDFGPRAFLARLSGQWPIRV